MKSMLKGINKVGRGIWIILFLLILLWPVATNGAFPDSLYLDSLKPGQRVTLTFKVTVNENTPADVQIITNQASISGSNFTAINTDNPNIPGQENPTETKVDNPDPLYDFSTDLYQANEGNNPNITNIVSIIRTSRVTLP